MNNRYLSIRINETTLKTILDLHISPGQDDPKLTPSDALSLNLPQFQAKIQALKLRPISNVMHLRYTSC